MRRASSYIVVGLLSVLSYNYACEVKFNEDSMQAATVWDLDFTSGLYSAHLAMSASTDVPCVRWLVVIRCISDHSYAHLIHFFPVEREAHALANEHF